MNTVEEIYTAINPMPALLSTKGKSRPEVTVQIEANTPPNIMLSWDKGHAAHDWERKYEHFRGDTVAQLVEQAKAFIILLPDAETSRLHDFMSQLGKVIDSGKDLGIDVGYLNPLTETMKRLSENALTHQPA